jgi:hypothetical protein
VFSGVLCVQLELMAFNRALQVAPPTPVSSRAGRQRFSSASPGVASPSSVPSLLDLKAAAGSKKPQRAFEAEDGSR